MESSKAVHLHLAGLIKGVHADLRKKYKLSAGDAEGVWAAHREDAATLERYAEAMHRLATQVWSQKAPQSRIEWTRQACMEYFRGGGLRKVLDKVSRRRKFYGDGHAESIATAAFSGSPLCGEVVNATVKGADSCPSPGERLLGDQDVITRIPATSGSLDPEQHGAASSTCVSVADVSDHENGEDVSRVPGRIPALSNPVVSPDFEGRIRLLDVGSCFNPFQEYSELLAVGIDIAPAVESVHKGDILNLSVTASLTCSQSDIDSYLERLSSPVTSLPAGVFHVVVFSLLLEYLPSAGQRWKCCQQAHRLLARHGLLVILTPDSHHQNRNAPMMKSWRTALEAMGFARWRYAKMEHLHCIAFRKASDDLVLGPLGGGGPNMLYIPQDFNTVVDPDPDSPAPDEVAVDPEGELRALEVMNLLPGIDTEEED